MYIFLEAQVKKHIPAKKNQKVDSTKNIEEKEEAFHDGENLEEELSLAFNEEKSKENDSGESKDSESEEDSEEEREFIFGFRKKRQTNRFVKYFVLD